MPHLIGLQLHSDNLAVAAMRPDQSIVLRPVHDLASVIQRAAAQRWKWSLAGEDRQGLGVAAARDLFLGLQHAMGDDHILASVAVPAVWGDRARRALLQAMEDTTVETMRLVRDTTALGVTAAVVNPDATGLCALLHLGTHKLEFALAEVSPSEVRVLARHSVQRLDGANVRFESLLPLITEVAAATAREAGVALRVVRRFVGSGRRAAQPALAGALGGICGVAAEVFPAGAMALGAAHVAGGLTGMTTPWNLVDDLDETPLANLRGKAPQRARRTSAPPPPMSAPPPRPHPAPPVGVPLAAEVHLVERHRPTARPRPMDAVRDVIVHRSPPPDHLSYPPPHAPSTSPPAEEGEHTDRRRISEPPSYAPPGGHLAEVGASGSFGGLASLDAVRNLHLLHPVEAEALAQPSLPTLLNQFTFLRSASGTLTLRHRAEEVALPIERGGVCLSPAERARALHPFDWSDGTFTWQREKLPWQVQKLRTPMTAFVVAGVRIRLRGFDDAAFTQLHLAKLRLAPSVDDERRSRLARLALPEAEERAVDYVLDGSRSFEAMLAEGYIGRGTMHRLVVVLDLYGILHWAQPAAAVTENPVVAMTRLLAKIEGRNHFLALGVHWSAPTDEIKQAWERMQASYGMGGSWQRHDPALAARIHQRGAAAWAVLRLDATRVHHRREAYPGMDEQLLAPLVEARAKALEMRGETSEAARMMRLRGEFAAAAGDDEAPAKPKR
jgi:hypothetical protein